jgi:hypothetical protein
LHALTRELAAECIALGSSDYEVSPRSFPDGAKYAPLDAGLAQRSANGNEAPTHTLSCG